MIKLVVSDLHVGCGAPPGRFNPFEDFYYDEPFEEFLRFHTDGEFKDQEIELILNGDILDLIKIPVNGRVTDQITEEIGVNKLVRALEGHPRFLGALRDFLQDRRHSMTYVMGNHDLEIAYPRVQEIFRSLVGGPENRHRIRFVVYEPFYDLPGGVRLYHGHQFEALNQVNPRKLFITEGYPEPILNLPWGSLFLLKVVLPAKEKRPYITLVQPFSRYLKLAMVTDTSFALPLSLKAFYYFIKTRFVESRKRAGDLRSTLKILKEEAVVYKDMADEAFKIMEREPGLRAIIMGHTHVALVRSGPGDRRYINTGTWTKHINLDLPELGAHTRWTYARIDYRNKPETPDIGLYQWFGSRQMTTEVRY